MKKIIVVLTNADHFEKNGEKTGLWLAEAADFVDVMENAGFAVDYVSPKGGTVPIDPRSLEAKYVSPEVENIYHSEDFRKRALEDTLSPENVQADDYIAIYYTGGHGVLFDFPGNKALQELAENIYKAGGYVCSVCHGVAGLFDIRNADGTYLIAGRKITGFTNTEEQLSGKKALAPFSTEDMAKERGAKFVKKMPFTSFAVTDGRLITGQNPMSGRAVAEALAEALQTDKNAAEGSGKPGTESPEDCMSIEDFTENEQQIRKGLSTAEISDKEAAEKILALVPDGWIRKIPFFVRKHATTKTIERIARQYPDLYAAARRPGDLPEEEREQLRKIITDIFREKMEKHKIR